MIVFGFKMVFAAKIIHSKNQNERKREIGKREIGAAEKSKQKSGAPNKRS